MADLNLEVNKAYIPLLRDNNRFIVLRGGAGSGKSFFLVQKALLMMLDPKNEDLIILVLRKVQASIKDSVFAEFTRAISKMGLSKRIRSVKHPQEIQYKSNKIIFTGVDDVEKLKSISQPNVIWMEEATEFMFEDFKQINLRLRGNLGIKQMWVSFNPIDDRHWLKAHFWDTPRQNATLLHTTYKDNMFLDEEYKAELEELKEYDRNYYNIYCLGEWGTASKGLVFPEWELYTDLPTEHVKSTVYGLDFGYNHPMALTRVHIGKDDIWCEEVFYGSGISVDKLIEMLPKLGVDKRSIIYCDSAMPDNIDKLKIARYNAVKATKGQNSVIQGIDTLKAYRINVHRNSYNIIKELGMYRWKEEGNNSKEDVFSQEVVKLNDDAMDSIRYAVHSHAAKGLPFIFFPK